MAGAIWQGNEVSDEQYKRLSAEREDDYKKLAPSEWTGKHFKFMRWGPQAHHEDQNRPYYDDEGKVWSRPPQAQVAPDVAKVEVDTNQARASADHADAYAGKLPPLVDDLPPLVDDPGSKVPLEADAALGLRTYSPARLPQGRVSGAPSELPGATDFDSSIMFRDPNSFVGLNVDPESGETSEVPDAVSEALRLSARGSVSSSAEEARKALVVSRDLGLGPESVLGNVKEYEAQQQEEKVRQLPAFRLRWWMSQTPQHAAAIQKELDQWATPEYLFGRYVYDQDKMQAWSRDLASGKASYKDRPQSEYQQPGWLMTYGRTMYSLSTSIQSHFMSVFGPEGERGKSVDAIKAQRDISMFPVPGENVYVYDAETDGAKALGTQHPVLSKVNSLIGMAPVIAAATIHPALGAALIYSETAGRTYEDLRLSGWDEKQAEDISEWVGFAAGGIAAATGGMFKFNFLPKATVLGMQGGSNAVVMSMAKNPTLWKAATGLGKNFVAATVMNMGMAASEVSIKEGFESARRGRPYDYSKVASATKEASEAWTEMLALSIIPAYKEHMARKTASAAVKQMSQDEVHRARFVEAVYDNYEQRGQALRSMHEASRIVAAAEALKGSEFAKNNPEDAAELLRGLIAPRGSQTVYLRPEAVAKLPPSALDALGHHDASFGAADGLVPVDLTSMLLHENGPELAKQAAGAPDLLPASKLGSLEIRTPGDRELDAWLLSERARGRDVGPTQAEIDAELSRALDIDPYAARDKDGPVLPGGERKPPPDLGPRERAKAAATGLPPMTDTGLRRWAQDAVSRLPTNELKAMGAQRNQQAAEATKEALDASRAATEHAKGGKADQTTASERRAADAERRAAVHGALGKALDSGAEETRGHVDYFSKLASDDPLPGGGMTARQAAWLAGPEFGAAHDAITEALGLAKKRGWAAPDLSDIYDKLARLGKLTKDGFEGWDLKQANELISQVGTMPERSLADLRVLRSVTEQIAKAADAENTVRANGIRVAKGMIRNQIAEHLKNIPDLPPGQRALADEDRALTTGQAVDKGRGSIAAELNKPSTLMLKLGPAGESLFFDSFVPGVARENAMWSDVEPMIREIDKNMPEELRRLGQDKVKFPDGEVRLRSSVWDLVLKSGVHGADSKIARGMGYRDYWEKGAGTITAERQLWNFISKNIADTAVNAHAVMDKLITPHWNLFEKYLWPQIEKMFKERGLAPPEKLDARKVTIHGREFQGSYGGRLKWFEANNKPIIHPGSLEALLGSDVSGPYTDQRHLAERDPEFAGKPMFSWDGVVSDIRKEIHDVAMRPFVEDAHKVFSDGEIRKLISDKMGKQALNQVYDPGGTTDWLHTVARGSVGDVQSAKVWAQALYKFQGLAAYSAFSLNTRVMLGQLSHIPAAMFGLGIEPGAMTAGVVAAFSPERRAWAHANSEVLKLRYSNYEERAIELTKQLTGLEPGRDAVRRATDHMNWMAWREMDAFLSHSIWEAAYDNALRGLGDAATHEQAVRQADIAVTKMMPSQDIYDQSAFVRDRSVAGFSYMVRNFPNTLANVAALNWWAARLKGGGAVGQAVPRAKAAAMFVGMVMAAEILGKGVLMQGGMRDNETPEDWYQKRVFGAMAYPYMISEPVTAAAMAVSGNRHGARQEMDRMLPASIQVVAQAIDDVGRLYQNGDEEAGLRALAHLSGLVLKTPLPGIGYNLSNAGRNSQDPIDAVMKGMGYKQ